MLIQIANEMICLPASINAMNQYTPNGVEPALSSSIQKNANACLASQRLLQMGYRLHRIPRNLFRQEKMNDTRVVRKKGRFYSIILKIHN
ncbi:hypothetical protein EUGRSUZ_H02405 [Eucalyptus grandis]|uniref:Uncharacterized protein n=2 Tax=Eucalyptus grandis TaxID=71139 RepID=A0ACC3JRU3_EUCGR|nr:hypothetical protein EUGRSUZ_H02405 [Eucalyptus grandis]